MHDKNQKIVGEGYISQLILDSKRLDHTFKGRDSMDFSEFAGGIARASFEAKPVSKSSTPLKHRQGGRQINLKLKLNSDNESSFRINSARS